MEELIRSAAIGGIVGATIAVLIIWLVTKNRKPDTSISSIPLDRKAFAINAPRADVIGSVARYAPGSGLNIEYSDPTQGLFILGENMNMLKNHNGYWIYILVTEHQTGNSVVDVAIKSKFYQLAVLLNRFRDRVFDALRASLAAEGRQILDAGTMRPAQMR